MEGNENNVTIDRLDYEILMMFVDKGATKPILSITRKELDLDDIPQPTLWKHLKKMVECGYLALGGKVGRNNMYYLTEKGKEFIYNSGGLSEEE